MNASRTLGPLVVGVVLLSSRSAFAGQHGAAAPPPMPIHMSSPSLHPMHVSHMRPFTPPKPVVYMPAYVPTYFPYGPAFGALSVGGFGLLGNRCENAMPQTLGDLGPAGNDLGFAPIALSATPAFDSLASAQPYASSQTPSSQMFCQPPAFDWSGLNLSF